MYICYVELPHRFYPGIPVTLYSRTEYKIRLKISNGLSTFCVYRLETDLIFFKDTISWLLRLIYIPVCACSIIYRTSEWEGIIRNFCLTFSSTVLVPCTEESLMILLHLGERCTVPKTRQISEKKREEVAWRENFPVIRGNDDYFPRITGKFSLQGTSSFLPTNICQIFGTVWFLLPCTRT